MNEALRCPFVKSDNHKFRNDTTDPPVIQNDVLEIRPQIIRKDTPPHFLKNELFGGRLASRIGTSRDIYDPLTRRQVKLNYKKKFV